MLYLTMKKPHARAVVWNGTRQAALEIGQILPCPLTVGAFGAASGNRLDVTLFTRGKNEPGIELQLNDVVVVRDGGDVMVMRRLDVERQFDVQAVPVATQPELPPNGRWAL